MKSTSRFALVLVAVVLVDLPTRANLLTATYESQLEAWLGQGNLTFTNIFTKSAGDDSRDFHSAVDGKGATFTLMHVFGTGGDPGALFDLLPQVVGGYNPQSWNSSGTWNYSPFDADRTAFLYNLSSGTIQRQNLIGQVSGPDYGQIQTNNNLNAGPTFGAGYDLVAHFDLSHGYAANASYGGTSFGAEITTGGPNFVYSWGEISRFYVLDLEVYTFIPAQNNAVPDSESTIGLITLSLFGLVVLRRRFSRG
ncbi:MAG: PEP_CTERM-anchored TLD domain-containing protein [Verrucomicrobia bacterium]|nr:PEP_CTERM-anchored TLD domain-containing protein [Verrucomicrobiota bacterium]